MSLLRPKSFLVLIVIGFSVVLMPLLMAMLAAEISVSRLVDQGTEAVYRSVAATEGGRILIERLVDLERKTRQYQVLKEPGLLKEITQKHQEFLGALDQLLELAPADQREVLIRLRAGINDLLESLRDEVRREAGEKIDLEAFVELNEMAKKVYFNSYDLIVQEVDSLHQHAGRTQQILFYTSVGLVPLTLILVIFFARLLSRPVKQINRGITRLGEGDFDIPIVVGGPQDLQFLGQRLDWLRQRLGEVEREKAKFIAHVSHELKTPLASIREGSELMVEEVAGPLTGQQREIAQILQKNSVQLQKLIENLLGFSRGRAQVPTVSNQVEILELVEGVLEDQRAAVLKKELQLQTRLAPMRLLGDRERLRTVIDNLLSNAVKYTPPGGTVELSIGREKKSVLIEVGDSGPGIPAEEKERIFEPFFQGRAPCLGHVQGTGIGLSIVKEYVTALRGQIEVAESPCGGALFRVRLPMAAEKKT